MTEIALVLIVIQGLVCLAFLRFVHSFGAYTESQRELTKALLQTHEANRAIHHCAVQLIAEVQRAKEKIA